MTTPWTSRILVWGEALRDYDFGPGHPLTPKRFGPGLDLLRALGAERLGRAGGGLGRGAAAPARAALHRAGALVLRSSLAAGGHGRGHRRCAGLPRHARGLSSDRRRLHRSGGADPRGRGRAMPSRRPAGCTTRCARGLPGSASTTMSHWRWRRPAMPATECSTSTLTSTTVTARRHSSGTTRRCSPISVHESGRSLFPGTGSVDELGAGKGEGFAVNMRRSTTAWGMSRGGRSWTSCCRCWPTCSSRPSSSPSTAAIPMRSIPWRTCV